ncbi:MAG: diaminopimelate epimerase [Bacillota bacterium]
MNFTKMQGAGNDYIYINCFQETVDDPGKLAIAISDRHFGVGGDGLVLILPAITPGTDARMRIFNADGSEAEMCGNAIRCVGKYLYDHQVIRKNPLLIETLAGIKQLRLEIAEDRVVAARVDMGEPRLDPDLIPVKIPKNRIVAEPIEVNNHRYLFTGVSMGNPHCVIFVPEITAAMIHQDGPALEVHPLFPRKTNVEFVRVISKELLEMRVWERGSGETMACGTGACAAAVAAMLNNLTADAVKVKLRGGDLFVEWERSTGHVFMTGPAVEVFQGKWPGNQ